MVNPHRQATDAESVNKKIHSQVQTHHLPRPYADEELKIIDSLLQATGDPRLELAVAIGLEAGLRIGELCELRVSDVELEKQRLRVRSSSRTGVQRFAYFHCRTKRALECWLGKRPDVSHDHLLTANSGIPLRKHLLRARLKDALCGDGKLTAFSFQRLGETAAARMCPEMDPLSAMANFGWRSERPFDRYRRLPSNESFSSYATAMESLTNQPEQSTLQSESLESYFQR